MLQLAIRNRTATVLLEHPPVNAISPAWCGEFDRILDELASSADWSVLHIRSALGIFSAGADLAVMEATLQRDNAGHALSESARVYQRFFSRIENLPQVTLVEIGGAAVGGGFELALACDLRIAGESAHVGLPEARLGLIPGAGGTQRLTQICGRPTAYRLILGAEVVPAQEAHRLGLVQWVAPDAELPEAARQIAERIAALPAEAVQRAKQCIRAQQLGGDAGFEEELRATAALVDLPQTQRAIAEFLSKKRK